ncbi:MAG: hypothetical protein HYV28_02810 [Ignavibacteriales bacterium]|nr:hypothetical protein [Ignavibacteriales bacterium]
MIDKTRPMDLGDIANITFNLLKVIFSKAVTFSAIVIVPATALAFTFFSIISNNASIGDNSPALVIMPVLAFYAGLFFLGIALIFIQIAVFIQAQKALNGEESTIEEMFFSVFSVKFWRVILMYILMLIPVMGIFLGVVIFATVIIVISGAKSAIAIFALLVPGYFLIFYFLISWTYGKVIIICEDLTASEALKRSYNLVDDNWWRTFGRVILFSLIIGLATMLCTIPLGFFLNGQDILKTAPAAGSGDLTQFKEYYIALYKFLIFVSAISFLIHSIITPVYELVSYYDLRIRNNEFPPEEPQIAALTDGQIADDNAIDLNTINSIPNDRG